MKRVPVTILFLGIWIFACVLAGCGGGSGGGGGGDIGSYAMIVSARTFVSVQQGIILQEMVMSGEAASNDNLTLLQPRQLILPGGTINEMGLTTGGIVASNYYYGSSTQVYSNVEDPFNESTQRQYTTGDLEVDEPLNGTYEGKIGSLDKTFSFPATQYMDALSDDDVSTTAGEGLLDVSNGDTITLANQNSSHIRYFCLIYDGMTSSTVTNLWASTDIRGIDWTDTDGLEDFYLNDTKAPSGGNVRWTIPGGILETGTNNLDVYIIGVNTDSVNSNTGGDFKTFVGATTTLHMVFSGQ